MNLRILAEADNAIILEDDINGFAVSIKLTDTETPAHVYEVKGQYSRVGVDIDPGTGLLIPGDKSAVTVRLSRFSLANLPDEDWTVETTDVNGGTFKGKATYVMLDRTAGRATILFKRAN